VLTAPAGRRRRAAPAARSRGRRRKRGRLPPTGPGIRRSGPVLPCRAFLRVMWETGLRRGTRFGLRAPEDYRGGAAELAIGLENDRARWGRPVPLPPAARTALDAMRPEQGVLFPEDDLRYQLRKAAEAAGLAAHRVPKLSHHDFRHARTTHPLDMGGSLTGTAYLVGHRQTTTKRYVHAGKAAAEAALELRSGCRSRTRGRGARRDEAHLGGGLQVPEIPGVCGREDSNLHGISTTRSLV
jgi:integrase